MSLLFSLFTRYQLLPMISPISCLPPEILDHIFSFINLPTSSPSTGKCGRLVCLGAAHVCHQWREIALNQPRFWGSIDFTALTWAGATEMLVRSKGAPLHLVLNFSRPNVHWNPERIHAFRELFVAHISRIHSLILSSDPHCLLKTVGRLASPAPAHESLSSSAGGESSSDRETPFQIPTTPPNSAAPKLIRLELDRCYISWGSPILKGLLHLKLLYHGDDKRPNLQSWLDAIRELSQLESLVVHSATPIASRIVVPIPERVQTVTLPCLTHLRISDAANCCALALAHLALPALARLRVDAVSFHANGADVRTVVPLFVRNAHGPQDTMPLQSMVISGCSTRTDILLWRVQDADAEYRDSDSFTRASFSARATFTALCPSWGIPTSNGVCDAVLRALPTSSLATLTVMNSMKVPREFWPATAPRWPLLQRVRLGLTNLTPFLRALIEEGHLKSPLFPSLTKLFITGSSLTTDIAILVRDMLLVRTKQGVPIQTVDLSKCVVAKGSMGYFKKLVTDLREPVRFSEEPTSTTCSACVIV